MRFIIKDARGRVVSVDESDIPEGAEILGKDVTPGSDPYSVTFSNVEPEEVDEWPFSVSDSDAGISQEQPESEPTASGSEKRWSEAIS